MNIRCKTEFLDTTMNKTREEEDFQCKIMYTFSFKEIASISTIESQIKRML